MPRWCSLDFRVRALRLLGEARPEYESEFEAIGQIV